MVLKETQLTCLTSCLEGHHPHALLGQQAQAASYLVLHKQISQHTESLYLENICCLKHSSGVLPTGVPAA